MNNHGDHECRCSECRMAAIECRQDVIDELVAEVRELVDQLRKVGDLRGLLLTRSNAEVLARRFSSN